MAGKGGERQGAGRKPKLLTDLLLSIPEAQEHVHVAFRVFTEAMSDDAHPIDTRMDAAREVLNRLCGKPSQAMTVSGPDGGPIESTAEVTTREVAEKGLREWQRRMLGQLGQLMLGPEGNPMAGDADTMADSETDSTPTPT